MGDSGITAYVLYHQLLDASRRLMGSQIHLGYIGTLSIAASVEAARAVLLERETVDTSDLDAQRALTAEFRHRYAALKANHEAPE